MKKEFFPLSLEIVPTADDEDHTHDRAASSVQLDVILTSLADYTNFVQLKKRIEQYSY